MRFVNGVCRPEGLRGVWAGPGVRANVYCFDLLTALGCDNRWAPAGKSRGWLTSDCGRTEGSDFFYHASALNVGIVIFLRFLPALLSPPRDAQAPAQCVRPDVPRQRIASDSACRCSPLKLSLCATLMNTPGGAVLVACVCVFVCMFLCVCGGVVAPSTR